MLMFGRRYRARGLAATAMLAASLLLAAGCAPKKPAAPRGPARPAQGVTESVAPRLAPVPAMSPEVGALVRQALEGGDLAGAIEGLTRLAAEAEPSLAVEARFRRVQLMLLAGDERAPAEASSLLAAYPDEPLVPYLHLWLAQQAEARQDDAAVLREARAALAHPKLTREVADHAAALGSAAARRSADEAAARWFLEMAGKPFFPDEQREAWLREAAARASLTLMARLREEGMISGGLLPKELGRRFLLHAARMRLMTGDMAAVRTIADWLATDFPGSPEARQAAGWAGGQVRQARIGVLLPLSGRYARFGREALRGMRLAMDALGDDEVMLRIADTGGDASRCADAWREVTDAGARVVIGPLLPACTKAILPLMRAAGGNNVPVIALAGGAELASRSPALFVHALGLPTQAEFMARRAWREGSRRVVVLEADTPSARREADAFAQTFVALGGEVADRVSLPAHGVDYRAALREMRMRTDDEELLAMLDEELSLFIAMPDLEIRMPVNFDGVYLALSGRRVALLAGQLAYVDVRDVPLYGTSRWQDGHLLDDRGRYLSRALFSDVPFPNSDAPDVRRFAVAWRGLWDGERPGKLAGIGYDTVLIAALLAGRLGLDGRDIMAALKDENGFPGLTGHVRFDENGMGRKTFKLFGVRRGRIVPAD